MCELKKCRYCKTQKPDTEEFWYVTNTLGKFLSGVCKECEDNKPVNTKNWPGRKTWDKMMRRCYDPKDSSWSAYGKVGVTVCEEWKDFDTFCGWYIRNKIEGWDMDKDLLQEDVPTNKKVYSPATCCFMPKYLNQWFVKRGLPKVILEGNSYTISISAKTEVFPVRSKLKGHSKEDVLEQWYLFKDLQLERRKWMIHREHDLINQEFPNSPEIHPTLISKLENFSMQKYLK